MGSSRFDVRDVFRRIPRPARSALWAMAGVISLYAATALALTVLLPPARLAAWVTPRLEAALGRPAEVGGVRMRVFPRVAIRVDGLSLANPEGFSDRSLLRLDALDLRPRMLPLLGRRIIVDEIRLTRPRLLVEANPQGELNLKALAPGGEPEGEAAARRGAPAAFAVRRLVVTDGIVLYDDRAAGRAIRVGDLDAELSLSGELAGADRFEARARATLGRLETRLAGADTVTALPPLAVEIDAAVQLDPDSAELRSVRLLLGEISVSGSGRLTRFRSDQREIAVSLEATGIDAGKVLASLPWADRLRGWRGTGTFDLALAAQGRAGGGTWPDVSGRLTFRDAGASAPAVPDLLSALTGEIRLDGGTARAEEIRGRLFGRPTSLAFRASGLLDPEIDARWKGEVPLEGLAKLGARSERRMSGVVAAELHVAGKPSDPASMRIAGPVTLTGITLEGPAPAVPVRIDAATLRFTGAGLRTERLPLGLGRSDLTLWFEAQNAVPALFADAAKPPALTFSARSRRLDWTELFPEKPGEVGYTQLLWARLGGRPVDGRPVEEVAGEQRFSLTTVPPFEADGSVTIDTFVQTNLRGTNVALRVALRDGVLRLSDLRASIHGGRAAGEASVDLRGGPPYPAQWTFAAESVQAGAFLDRFTLLHGAVTGTLTFRLDGRGRLDPYLLPIADDLRAEARSVLVNGAVQNWGPTNSLASFLRNDRLRELRVRRWAGALEIVGSQVRFQDWALQGDRLAASLGGAFGFDGRLNAALRLQIDSSLARQLAGPAASALVTDAGSSWLALRMTGPARGPTLALDTEAMRQMAAAATQRRLTEETREVREDVEKKLQEEVGGRLRRLFGGRDTTRADTAKRDTAP